MRWKCHNRKILAHGLSFLDSNHLQKQKLGAGYVTCSAQAIRIPDLISANKDCLQRVFRHQQVEGNFCHVDLQNAPGVPDKMKMNPW